MEGQGTLTQTDGKVYQGSWKDNKMNGKGMFTWPDGSKYEGDFVND